MREASRREVPSIEAAMGAAIIGAYAVPINWHFKTKEVSHILGDCEAKLLVIHADLLPDVKDAIPDAVKILVVKITKVNQERFWI